MPLLSFIDNSRLIVESLVQSGADVFIGYPITPSNLLYAYSRQRFPHFIAAPDEITTLQLMSGLACTGKLPVTATSFPGFALMIESINMAYMMELPMVIVLTQRLGPATGTATCGAQGDMLTVYGMISGGFQTPVLTFCNYNDYWTIPHEAVRISIELRTPVILMTSKEEVMTQYVRDIETLQQHTPIPRRYYEGNEPYKPYKPDNRLVPEFVPVSSNKYQVRITASTHNQDGIIQSTSAEGLVNSLRLQKKIEQNLHTFTFYELDEEDDAQVLVVSWGITAFATRKAIEQLRSDGVKVSALYPNTLLPVPQEYYSIFKKYCQVIFAEENFSGQYARILFGYQLPPHVKVVGAFGQMISPEQIIETVKS